MTWRRIKPDMAFCTASTLPRHQQKKRALHRDPQWLENVVGAASQKVGMSLKGGAPLCCRVWLSVSWMCPETSPQATFDRAIRVAAWQADSGHRLHYQIALPDAIVRASIAWTLQLLRTIGVAAFAQTLPYKGIYHCTTYHHR